MEVLTEPSNKESILKALSQVPIATTAQLGTLNNSLEPRKKSSRLLTEMETSKLVQWKWHGQEKVWSLTKKGRQLQQCTPMRFPNEVTHALSLISLYFQLKPKHWLYEPIERFEHMGKEYVWAPDCIFSYQKKVYVCELQRTRITQKRWALKWKAYNLYFNRDFFHSATFQQWSTKTILPNFLVITSQQPDIVKNGFEIKDRELIICREFR